ncbi:MAG TPA: hypothetical protein VN634_19510 [Candidatus Limnocylindrales bacterium]|nr:hypothetical protein [Candidatus Limnocylindrales bacterium]
MNRSHTTIRRFCAIALLAFVPAGAATPAWADPFFFSTNDADGLLAALSQPAASRTLETETADDFLLGETTVISEATIVGLIPDGASVADIGDVEIEIYHVFPRDSAVPASTAVPSRVNSPSDVEIDSATRDGAEGTLAFDVDLLEASFAAANSVVDGIHPAPANQTNGDGPTSGKAVQITMRFTPPIVLPAEHYFFRPEVQVTGGDFLFLSAPKPIVSPGTTFLGDLQAWIRNSALRPDWLRIGTDIVGGAPVHTFNMTVSLAGQTVPGAGTPGTASCHGKTISALSDQFGDIDAAAADMGFAGPGPLQDELREFCDAVQLQKPHKRADRRRR